MGIYQRIGELWKKPKENMPAQYRAHLIAWRREPVTLRLQHPTRLDRARSLGYRAKQGILIVRQRVSAGGHKRENFAGGRHSKHFRMRMILAKNYKLIAEERANKQFPNCEVLNSYFVGGDSKHYWYEVILVDRAHPAVRADSRISWMANPAQRGRVFRGRTSAGRKIRGLRHKGKGAEGLRPSKTANN
jgi:large subunit ribosomal protein L15e